MTELEKGQKTDRDTKKHFWFGYGNYSTNPILQIGGGNVRDPGLFEWLFKNARADHSPMRFLIYIIAGVIGLMVLAMLGAWVVSFFLR